MLRKLLSISLTDLARRTHYRITHCISAAQVMIAIGGWNEGSAKYSQMAGSQERRQQFVASALQFLTKHGKLS